MPWSTVITVPPGKTIRQAANEVDLSEPDKQHKDQFWMGVKAAEDLLDIGKTPSDEFFVRMTVYADGFFEDGEVSETKEYRGININLEGVPKYDESTTP